MVSGPPRSPTRLVLTGLMGAGKTTVGRLIAARLGRPFVDTDRVVEEEAGLSVAEVFDKEGEGGFRLRERQAVDRALSEPGAVIALGGGAVTDPQTRDKIAAAAEVVWLTAAPTSLAERLGDGQSRPLLEGEDVSKVLEKLLVERQDAYEACDRRVDTTGRTPEAVADAVLAAPIIAWHGSHKYPIHVLSGGLSGAAGPLRSAFPTAKRLFVVADDRVADLHGDGLAEALRVAGFSWSTVRLEIGEASKGLGTVERVWRHLASSQVERDTPVLAFGGGVTTDLAGFAAAAWKRGVPWVVVPTTLLAQVDAGVGGKTGVNLPEGKNLVGAFHPPSLVIMPTGCLSTVPDREIRSGLAEAIKSALIGDVGLLELLEQSRDAVMRRSPDILADVVRRSVIVKTEVVREDPEERSGARRKLNLGHTAGHAIEAVTGYARFTHGEAVALGIVLASRVSVQLGSLTMAEADRIEAAMAGYGLPTDTSPWAGDGVEALRAALLQDKKVIDGKVRFVIPEGISMVKEVALEPDDLLARLGQAADTTSGG